MNTNLSRGSEKERILIKGKIQIGENVGVGDVRMNLIFPRFLNKRQTEVLLQQQGITEKSFGRRMILVGYVLEALLMLDHLRHLIYSGMCINLKSHLMTMY